MIAIAVVGFNFMKLTVERGELLKGKINIQNNVAIKDVEETELGLGQAKQRGLKFSFEFTSSFEPKLASITLAGNVLYLSDKDKTAGILDGWKKSKKVPPDVMTEVLNTVLTKCNIEALMLARDFNLPSPVPLPKIEPT